MPKRWRKCCGHACGSDVAGTRDKDMRRGSLERSPWGPERPHCNNIDQRLLVDLPGSVAFSGYACLAVCRPLPAQLLAFLLQSLALQLAAAHLLLGRQPPHVDTAPEGQAVDRHPRATGPARAGGPVVEAAHDAHAVDHDL